jgi:DDE_Tnp_1-associated
MVPFADLLAALEGIPDPRRRQGRRYPLAPLLLFSVLAVLAGATSYRGILTFIGVHRERLNAVFGARFRRAPAVNTLRGLFLSRPIWRPPSASMPGRWPTGRRPRGRG